MLLTSGWDVEREMCIFHILYVLSEGMDELFVDQPSLEASLRLELIMRRDLFQRMLDDPSTPPIIRTVHDSSEKDPSVEHDRGVYNSSEEDPLTEQDWGVRDSLEEDPFAEQDWGVVLETDFDSSDEPEEVDDPSMESDRVVLESDDEDARTESVVSSEA